jgi:hypothetical protein
MLKALQSGGDPEPLTHAAVLALAEAGAPAGMVREVSRLAAIVAVDEKIKQAGRTERGSALFKAARAMLVANAPPEEIFPLIEMQRDLGGGGKKSRGRKPRKLSYRTTLATFAAAVTILKKGRTVAAAIAEVATPNGIDRKELKNFRDRLNRGLVNDGSKEVYRLMLATFKSMPRDKIMSVLSRTSGRFVPNPRFLGTCTPLGRDDDLPFRVELWDDADRHVEELIALASDFSTAQSAYENAMKRRPGKLITLRQKPRVIKKSR